MRNNNKAVLNKDDPFWKIRQLWMKSAKYLTFAWAKLDGIDFAKYAGNSTKSNKELLRQKYWKFPKKISDIFLELFRQGLARNTGHFEFAFYFWITVYLC